MTEPRPPIFTEAPGGGNLNRRGQERKPNWHEWLNIPTVSVEEAVALSCDIDPNKVERTARPIGRASILESEGFMTRLRMALRNLEPGGALEGWRRTGRGRLHEFASWAGKHGWSMPKELAALVVVEPEPREEQLGEKERLTFLKLVLGMAVAGYEYDPKSKRSDTVAKICQDLDTLKIQVDPDTVRKKLREAAQRVEYQPWKQ